jgi:hypothetical protein
MQNEHVQARAGISKGSGCQSSAKEMLPQWQRPEINITHLFPESTRPVMASVILGDKLATRQHLA